MKKDSILLLTCCTAFAVCMVVFSEPVEDYKTKEVKVDAEEDSGLSAAEVFFLAPLVSPY